MNIINILFQKYKVICDSFIQYLYYMQNQDIQQTQVGVQQIAQQQVETKQQVKNVSQAEESSVAIQPSNIPQYQPTITTNSLEANQAPINRELHQKQQNQDSLQNNEFLQVGLKSINDQSEPNQSSNVFNVLGQKNEEEQKQQPQNSTLQEAEKAQQQKITEQKQKQATLQVEPIIQQNKQAEQKVANKVVESEKPAITVKIFQQKIAQASELKNNGNSFFKQKNYIQAIKKYSQGLKLLDPTHFYAATPEECKKMAQLSATLLCNIGFCYFNSHDMVRADLYFTQAIAINPKYTKALHKRALARYELQKYQEAMEDIKIAFNLEKTNAQIHAAYSKILEKFNQQAKKTKQKMKELSSKIFNNDTQKSDSPTKKLEKSQIKGQNKQNDKNKLKQTNKNQKGEPSKQGWSWGSIVSFAGAAAIIGAGIYKALSKN